MYSREHGQRVSLQHAHVWRTTEAEILGWQSVFNLLIGLCSHIIVPVGEGPDDPAVSMVCLNCYPLYKTFLPAQGIWLLGLARAHTQFFTEGTVQLCCSALAWLLVNIWLRSIQPG